MILGSGLLTSSWPKASDWLIRDEFTDTVAAGSVNGTAATPGPGTRAVTDANNLLSIGSGVLSAATGAGAAFSVHLSFDGVARTPGRAIFWNTARDDATYNRPIVGFWSSPGSILTVNASVYYRAGSVYFWDQASLLGQETAATTNLQGALILRSVGAIWIVKSSLTYKLAWVYPLKSDATVYPFVASGDIRAWTADFIRVIQLPAPFDTDDGLATDILSGAVSAGTTFSHESDVWMEFAATTVPSSDSIDVQFRKADALNYWICRINSSGDISLEEVVDGSETQRGLAAGVVSNGHRVVIIADDESIRVLSNNTSRISYGSAASAKTATAGEVDALGTGGAVSNLKTWPRTLSGTAAAILDKVSA